MAEVEGKTPPALLVRQSFNMDPSQQDRDMFSLHMGWKSTEPALISQEK